ncbi:hypothetical protein [Polyangium mundeleinium]|uniref:Uncharacterized protein n=1 Tax=Polyangium mundeleinium TaxID=2995306 RepID=A0ABT5EEA2_9BACT|nr:hypothetical protein [Polyangium mundeleinium]MDC0740091.1 hypothetical protein [Polyangium mundeleinium]
MPLPHCRATALLALLSLACGCRDATTPNERAPSAALTQSVSAAPTSTSKEPPRNAAPLGPASPLVEFEGLAKLDHKPLAVLRERNPWLMVLGSDVPTIVVYEDGLVVYHKLVGDKAEALTVNVGAEAARKLVEELATAEFMALPAQISVTDATDQPRVGIALRQGSQWKYASVEGITRNGKATAGETGVAPAVFVRAYQRLANFHAPGATPWAPETIEIMLWDFSHARTPPLPWPAGIPAPPADVKAPKEGVYHHHVPGRHEAATRAFIASLEQSQGVSVGGASASIGVRRVVPSDIYIGTMIRCAWMKSIPNARLPTGCR